MWRHAPGEAVVSPMPMGVTLHCLSSVDILSYGLWALGGVYFVVETLAAARVLSLTQRTGANVIVSFLGGADWRHWLLSV